jgi:hypothetical protein
LPEVIDEVVASVDVLWFEISAGVGFHVGCRQVFLGVGGGGFVVIWWSGGVIMGWLELGVNIEMCFF